MTGVDIPVDGIPLLIHNPTITEISLMGDKDFFLAMQYFCLEKNQLIQDKKVLDSLTNFQVLMKIIQQTQNKKSLIQTFLLLLFPQYNITILPSSIILSSKDMPVVTIDDNNFDILQDYIRTILCAHNLFQGENIIYKPANKAAQAIADKLMAGRKKVADIKNKEGGNESVLTRYVSILTIGTNSMNLRDCCNLTLFQLFDLMERYTAYNEWNMDFKVRLAGGDPKHETESWMRNLYTKETNTAFTAKDGGISVY